TMSKSLKKIVEESRDRNLPEVEMCDRGISSMLDIPGLFTLSHITQLVLSHNKLTGILCGFPSRDSLAVGSLAREPEEVGPRARKRGGVWQQVRRLGHRRIPLPTVTLANVHSLRNKLDNLQGHVKYVAEYRSTSLLALTETW
ncbi:hypothetical protein GOODEAATRI_018167, partial [Goodea atripinnis]